VTEGFIFARQESMSASQSTAAKTPEIIDAGKFTRTQLTALGTVLEIQRAAHISPDYRRHLSTLVLRNLTLDDLSIVIKAAAKPQSPANLPKVVA
jgi:hypothetical protein